MYFISMLKLEKIKVNFNFQLLCTRSVLVLQQKCAPMTFTLKNLLTIIWIKINALIIAMETITASLYPMRSNRMVLRSAVNIDRAINLVLETMLQQPILKMELAQVLCYSSGSENA